MKTIVRLAAISGILTLVVMALVSIRRGDLLVWDLIPALRGYAVLLLFGGILVLTVRTARASGPTWPPELFGAIALGGLAILETLLSFPELMFGSLAPVPRDIPMLVRLAIYVPVGVFIGWAARASRAA